MTKIVIVLGTEARGGIRSVIDAYDAAGFYQEFNTRRIVSHAEGSLAARVLTAAKAFSVVAWLLATKQVALLHMHMSMRGSFWRKYVFQTMAHWVDVPTLVHLHGSEFAVFYEGSSNAVQARVRRIFDRAAGIVVLSSAWREFVEKLTDRPVNIVGNFAPDNFDLQAVESKRKWKNFVFLGEFGQRKGIFDLVPAFANAAARQKGTHLYCGGNGEVDAVREYVAEMAAEHVISVPGWVVGEDKKALLIENGIFILPSYNEGLPMAIIEAMSMGMPVVSTNVGGIPELVSAENGILIEAGDRDALEGAILEMLGLPEARLQEMGKASRQLYLKRFSPEACLGDMRRIYERIGL